MARLDGYDFAAARVKPELNDVTWARLPNAEINQMSLFALSAAAEALRTAKLSAVNPRATGVIMGCSPALTADAKLYQMLMDGQLREIAPKNLTEFTHQSCGYHPAALIASALGVRKLCRAISNACASGAYAVSLGFELIKNGMLEMAIVGGADAMINSNGLSLFSTLGVMSNDSDYEHASRPFDKNRSGFVIGEGAGVLILESFDGAARRGARAYAEILGCGAITDTYHITTPDPSGKTCADTMAGAIANSGLSPDEIDYINAHGTATYYNDSVETSGIKQVFKGKAYDVPVSSLKSMIGHLLSAAGAVELIATILMINNSTILPTSNYEAPDSECDLDYVPNVSRRKEIRCAMSNSFGFGGQNVSIVVGRTER
jgi:3-oxoacyl-(acyl-carrier-protein) synthase